MINGRRIDDNAPALFFAPGTNGISFLGFFPKKNRQV